MAENEGELRHLLQAKSRKFKSALGEFSSSPTAVSIWAYSKLALAGVLGALLMVFSVQNADSVRVIFLGWGTEMSQALVVFSAGVVGVVFGVAVSSWLGWRASRPALPPAQTPGP